MSSDVRTIMVISGEPMEMKKLCDLINEKGFSLNHFVPMPESLDIESGSLTDVALVLYCQKLLGNNVRDIPAEVLPFLDGISFYYILNPRTKGLTPNSQLSWELLIDRSENFCEHWKEHHTKEEILNFGEKVYNNILRYGAPTWYEWRKKNWGAKNDVYEIECGQVDANGIRLNFNTTNSFVGPAIKAMSEQFPNLSITGKYAGEDIGYNCGVYSFCGKSNLHTVETPSKGSEEAIRLSCEVWGYDPEIYLALWGKQ